VNQRSGAINKYFGEKQKSMKRENYIGW